MVLCLDRMSQCGLHAVLWSHIGTLMRLLAAEPRCTARFLFLSHCPSGTNFLTPYSMVRDWRISRAGTMLFYWPKLLYPCYSLTIFPFLFFLSIVWYCGAMVFGLIWVSLSALHCRPLLIIIIIIHTARALHISKGPAYICSNLHTAEALHISAATYTPQGPGIDLQQRTHRRGPAYICSIVHTAGALHIFLCLVFISLNVDMKKCENK